MQKIIDYVNMNRVFIPSVMHSGTIFTRNLIGYAGYKYFMIYLWGAGENAPEGVKIVDSVQENKVYFVDNASDLASMIKTSNFNFNIGDENCNEGIGVIHAHVSQSRIGFIKDNFTISLMHAFKTVIPIRDPLLVLGTRYKRMLNKNEDDLIDCTEIVDGFCLFAKYYSRGMHFLLPVDLYSQREEEDRIDILKDLFQYIGLPCSDQYLAEAAKWEKRNVSLENYKINNLKPVTLQAMIKTRDLDGIKEIMGKDYDYLKSKEDIIRPFLEDIGYVDLLWWD